VAFSHCPKQHISSSTRRSKQRRSDCVRTVESAEQSVSRRSGESDLGRRAPAAKGSSARDRREPCCADVEALRGSDALNFNGGSIADVGAQIDHFRKGYKVIAMDSRDQGNAGDSPDKLTYER
jgi:hypothetical protein